LFLLAADFFRIRRLGNCIRPLSIPIEYKTLSKCSVVEIRTPWRIRLVAYETRATWRQLAGNSKLDRSVRRKTIPVPAKAGWIVILTGTPLWRPTPFADTGFATEVSKRKPKNTKNGNQLKAK